MRGRGWGDPIPTTGQKAWHSGEVDGEKGPSKIVSESKIDMVWLYRSRIPWGGGPIPSLADSTPWNRFLGSLNVYKFGLGCQR